jgi:hypothetical protein
MTEKIKIFDHQIQLELRDFGGFPVPNTQFWITVTIRQQGPFVTIQLPAINFQTGPASGNEAEVGFPVVINGGYLYTSDGFLPCNLRPNDVINRSYFGPSNNGPNLAFSYADTPAELPVPKPGYIIQIDNAGAVIIQGIGTISNIIPPGQQNLLPTTISYLVGPELKLRKNVQLSTGFINTTKFSDEFAQNGFFDALRDSHVNDTFNRTVALAWSDNSTTNQTETVMNLAVAVGKVNAKGQLEITSNQIITNLTPGLYVWDTAIAISRINPNLIVASFGRINYIEFSILPFVAVSQDAGQNWTIQPLPIATPFDAGGADQRGVSCDKFGNFWYLSTFALDQFGNFVNQPFLALSTDGFNWTLVFTAPYLNDQGFPISYDYPQFCFGNDNQGNYGVWLIASAQSGVNTPPNFSVDTIPFVAFIPVTGLGADKVGTPQQTFLTQFLNNATGANITASEDGRVWTLGEGEEVFFAYPGSGIINMRMLFKSPGSLPENWAGPWDSKIVNSISSGYGGDNANQYFSQPSFGMFNSVQTIIYDDTRKALYSVVNGLYPYNSQNDQIQFFISRNNGQTLSNPININTTKFANRGFQSMALDPVTGDLVFGWYDGRNDTSGTFTNLQYFAAVINAATLDKLVNQIPLSDPIYSIPAGGFQTTSDKSKQTQSHSNEAVQAQARKLRQARQSRKSKFLLKLKRAATSTS